MTEQPSKGSTVKCYLCDTTVSPADEYWCAGCKEVVCTGCGEAPMGRHDASDHQPPCDICGECDHDEADCEAYEEDD